jgi:hypothetical protein
VRGAASLTSPRGELLDARGAEENEKPHPVARAGLRKK